MNENFERICFAHYHEIGLKGKNRSYFELALLRNIEKILQNEGHKNFSIKRISGRILILLDKTYDKEKSNDVLNLIKNIPGCARVSSGFKCSQNVESMVEAGCLIMSEYGAENGDVESFKVQARRNHTNFELDSMQINQIVGGKISDAFPNVKVKMKDPSLEIHIEVIEGACYLYANSLVGIGGLPVGTGGKLVSMLSSGIDSPVAM